MYEKDSSVFGIMGTPEEISDIVGAIYRVGVNINEADLMKVLKPSSRQKWHDLIFRIGKIINY